MADVTLDISASPTLEAFIRSNERIRVIIGPVGSGKTSTCALELLRRACEQKPGPDGIRRTRWAVIRNTYRELTDTTRKTFEDWVKHPLGRWYESDFTYALEVKDLHIEILFRSLDRPEDIRKLLSLELTGAFINECREVPKAVLDMLDLRIGRYPSMRDGGATWCGIWADSNPPHTGHWLYKLMVENKPEHFKLFHQPGGMSPLAENKHNLRPGYYEQICQGKDEEWINCYVNSQFPSADVGSYYGNLLGNLAARGGLQAFQHETDGVFTSWDLGHDDSTAIWFWRFSKRTVDIGNGTRPNIVRLPDFIGHYESYGEPMSYYFDYIDKRRLTEGYQYVKHWLPHDARAKTLVTGSSILEDCLAHWGPDKVAVVPMLSVEDGIQATRWLLEQDIRIHPRCSERQDGKDTDGVECLREYRRQWDAVNQCFKPKPLHDWSSHSADAFRMAAVVCRLSELNTRVKPPPETSKVPYDWRQHPLNSIGELFKENERRWR